MQGQSDFEEGWVVSEAVVRGGCASGGLALQTGVRFGKEQSWLAATRGVDVL